MQQSLALEIMEDGHNVLLTGAAGAGKTFVLAEFIKRAKRRGRSVSVTASTGLAATHLGGNTIHAWSGIGIADQLPGDWLRTLSKTRREVISKADILVIDEISMLHDYRLDMVDAVTRAVRDSDEPFGGLQVILCGDFFQLPPVQRGGDGSSNFATNASVWSTMELVTCYLHEQHRQDDQALLGILDAIRNQTIEQEHVDQLVHRQDAALAGTTAITELHTTNVDVDQLNATRLAAIDGEEKHFQMQTTGNERSIETLKRSCLAPETLSLKVGAVVMCIKNNFQRKFVNGSLGIVESFDKESGFPIVKLNNGRTMLLEPDTWELRDGDLKRAGLTQLPLRLAWAVTVHKSQGMTLDAARMDLRKSFVPGMGYVALSRVRRLETLSLAGINRMALQISEAALEIDGQLRQASATAEQRFADLEARATKRAAMPTTVVAPAGTWATKLERMRQTHPNAYRPWAASDDAKLKALFEQQTSLKELTSAFGRHPGSIRARLQKHYGEDVVVPS